MAYLARLRVKWTLIRVALVMVAIIALAQIADFWDHRPHGIVNLEASDTNIPLWLFIAVAAWGAAIVATIFGTTLYRQRDHRAIAWTVPVSRARTAATIVLIDLAGIVVGYAVMLFFVIAPMTGYLVAGNVRVSGTELPVFAFGIAFAFLWYGLIQASTAWCSTRGGVIAGLSWPTFIVLGFLELAKGLPEPIRWLIGVVDLINPMMYLGRLFTFVHERHHMFTPLPLSEVLTSTVTMLGIAAVALAIAIAGWRRPVA